MRSKLRKLSAGFVAVVLVGAMVLTGTLAWNHASEMALNETGDSVNPGGRLHDDFNGENKDIYVENFSDSENGGVPIFARIRLYEYMEIGEGAGILSTESGTNNATPLVSTANINDKSSWTPHKPTASVLECTGGDSLRFHDYWSWEMGGKTVYMPTFNMDKDSLVADINGTWAGPDGDRSDDSDAYLDYHQYELGETKTVDGVTHTAVETLDAQVMTMQQWKDDGAELGSYWVIDTDGWAYWANPIQPGTATGLLLSNIKQIRMPDNTWYYGIHVEAQFATAGNWGQDDSTGFYKDPDAVPSADGLYLLNKAAGRLPQVTGLTIQDTVDGTLYAKVNSDLELKAEVDLVFPSGASKEKYVRWEMDPEHTALQGSVFHPTDDMIGMTFTITAISDYNEEITDQAKLVVIPYDAIGVEIGELDGRTYVKYADNTYREILEDGVLGDFVCAYEDKRIGNEDDRYNVVPYEEPLTDEFGKSYGLRFLGPDGDDCYRAMGEDGLLGTEDDIRLMSAIGEWPKEPVIPAVTLTGIPAKVDAGDKVTTIEAATSPIENCEISWSVEDNSSADTYITSTGVLYIGSNETPGTITVVARTKGMGGVEQRQEIQVYNPTVTIGYSSANGKNVAKGMTRQFSINVTNGKQPSTSYIVTKWDVENEAQTGTAIDQNGLLSIDFNEEVDSKLNIVATLENGRSVTLEVDVVDCVTIDGEEWWVVVKEEADENGNGVPEEVLLLQRDGYTSYEHDPNVCDNRDEGYRWGNNNGTREWFHKMLDNDWTTLGQPGVVNPVTIYTRKHYASTTDWETTSDRVFLLAEADYTGKHNGDPTSDIRDYTYDGKPLPIEEYMKDSRVVDVENLRNLNECSSTTFGWAAVRDRSDTFMAGYDYPFDGVIMDGCRPALWAISTVQPD